MNLFYSEFPVSDNDIVIHYCMLYCMQYDKHYMYLEQLKDEKTNLDLRKTVWGSYDEINIILKSVNMLHAFV